MELSAKWSCQEWGCDWASDIFLQLLLAVVSCTWRADGDSLPHLWIFMNSVSDICSWQVISIWTGIQCDMLCLRRGVLSNSQHNWPYAPPSLNCSAEPFLWLQMNFLRLVMVVYLQRLATDQQCIQTNQCNTTWHIHIGCFRYGRIKSVILSNS